MDALLNDKTKKDRDGYKFVLCIVNMGWESKPYNMWVGSYELSNGTLTFC